MKGLQRENMKATDARQLEEFGFLRKDVDPTKDLEREVIRLKEEKNAILLAHYYQESEIQDLADYVGDSLGLSQKAASADADIIVFAGVHFMAETAKILNPGKKVLLPDLKAGCSLADSCPAPVFKKFKAQYPEHKVISYINCTAALKTMTDICCTSSNAEIIINSLPVNEKIIFAPDRNLGKYLMKKTDRDMILWNGSCMVHEIFSQEKITKLKHQYPEALLIAHPECEDHLLENADFIGSTSQLIQYSVSSEASQFIVATEAGILHEMRKQAPEKEFIPAPPQNNCACNECPHMRRNTLEKLYLCLEYELPEIHLDDKIIEESRSCIDRMLEISARAGL